MTTIRVVTVCRDCGQPKDACACDAEAAHKWRLHQAEQLLGDLGYVPAEGGWRRPDDT